MSPKIIKRKRVRLLKCSDCERKFRNAGGLARHSSVAHPFVPPPPPKVTVVEADSNFGLTNKTLIDGAYLEVGDVFYRVEKCVIKRTEHTEGNENVKVGYEITKSHWQKNKPV